MAEVLINVKAVLDKKGMQDLKTGLGKISSFAGPALAATGAAAAAAFGVATKEALDFANDTNAAMDQLAFTTGATTKEMGQFKDIALGIFAQNWGDSIEDVAGVLAEVRNLTGKSGDELENISKKALILRDRFGKDISESVDAANVLMERFGLSSGEAFDFMVTGIQKGLDRNGDFLDSIREYGNLFDDAGFDASQFFSLMETGAAGGVLGVDKISDAIKEFGIIANEGGKDVQDAFGALGLDFAQIQASVAAGDENWADYFDRIIAGLQSIEDPIERARLQTEIFGTMAEDLGASFTDELSDASTTIEDMSGAMQQAGQDGQDLGTLWEGAMRQFQVAVEPIGQELLPILAEGIRAAGAFLVEARPVFSGFATDLKETLGPAMLLIEDAAVRIAKAFGVAGEETTGLDVALKVLAGGLDVIVTGIEAVAIAAQGLAWVVEQISEAIDVAKDLIDQLQTIASLGGSGALLGAGIGAQSALLGAITGFQAGGIVPGPIGAPQLAVVHGGETITPAGRGAINFSPTINVSGGGGPDIAGEIIAALQEYTDTVLVPALS